MKATLEFNLNDPEDVQAHLRCLKSLDMAIIFFEIVNNLHRKLPENADANTVIDRVNELLEDNDININNLID